MVFGVEGFVCGVGCASDADNLGISDHAGDGSFEIRHLARLVRLPATHPPPDVRLPGKENLNSHGARPVHLIITMIKWIRTGRLSIKNSSVLTT